MVLKRDVVRKRVLNIAGVPLSWTRSMRETPERPDGSIGPIPSVTLVTPLHTPPEVLPELLWWFDDTTLICKEATGGEAFSNSAHIFKTRSECQVALAKERRLPTTIPPRPPVTTTIPPRPPVTTTIPPRPPVTTTVPPRPPVTTTIPPRPPVTTTVPPRPPVTTTIPPRPPVPTTIPPRPPVPTAVPPRPPVTTTIPPRPPVPTAVPPRPPVTTTIPPRPPVTTTIPPRPPVTTTVPPRPPVTTTVPPRPPVTPVKDKGWYFDDTTLICKEATGGEAFSNSAHIFKTRSECQVALAKHKLETRREARGMPPGIARPRKRKVSARVEEIMNKRSFPKAVKEAIEKGLERKDAPLDIERIIEKVAKTNEPGYILRRTIAKRIGTRGTVQYKVDTDKGTIIYENADEKTANAILGMPTPTGEVIPLQIKVIRK